MRSDHVAQLAAQMRRGEWLMNGSTVVFDTKGLLLDGHHRLMACHVSGVTVKFLVVWQADPAALFTIDSGRSRTLGDHLAMHGGTNTNQRASYLAACVRIVTGHAVSLKTMESYRAWWAIFKEGFELYFDLSMHNTRFLRTAAVAGPLIVGFKANPEEVQNVWVGLRDGADLKSDSPIYALREFLMRAETSRLARDSAEGMAAKIFAVLLAHPEGRPLRRIQANTEASQHFRDLYSRGNARKMIDEAKDVRAGARRLVENVVPGVK